MGDARNFDREGVLLQGREEGDRRTPLPIRSRIGEPLQLEKDTALEPCNPSSMELQTGRIFESEVTEIDGYWVRVAVAQDERFAEQFLCEVSLYRREPDSDWGDLDVDKPVDEPQVLREFSSPGAAYEHGLALGHILTTMY
jgi:hypothetical protein